MDRRISRAFIIAFALLAFPLAAESDLIKLEAVASYYGDEFQGRPTSSGELFDMNAYTCAHKNLPFGTILEVTNLANGRKTVVRVNDRGPFVAGREIDVSKAAAYDLGMVTTGTARVSIRKVGMDGPGTENAINPSASETARSSASPTALGAPGPAAGAPIAAAQTGTMPEKAPTPAQPASATQTASATQSPVSASNVAGSGAASEETRWRIQLGSFSKPENADRMVVQLRKDGFNPAIERNGTMTRVVLAGIPDSALASIKGRLAAAGYGNCLIRGE